MLLSILFMILPAAGGLSLSYALGLQERLLWRISAGIVIGSAIAGTLAFVLSLIFGLTVATAAAVLVLSASPIVLFRNGARRKHLAEDWARAKGRLQGFDTAKFGRFAYYALFLLLFLLFFDRAMSEGPNGIFTGGSQNLGDLPFHLGAIFSFTDGGNFPPQNPSFAGARFSYPFVADIFTAVFVKLGAGVRDAMFVQNVLWAFSLLVILEQFVFAQLQNKAAAKLAPIILFFSGGLGFGVFLSDYWHQSRSFFDFIWALPRDYTISDLFRWGNSLVVMFITQRSLLLGLPLTLIVLGILWNAYAPVHAIPSASGKRRYVPLVLAGAIAGMLPLVHLHSLAVLFVVGVFLLILKPERWREWTLFAGGVAIVAIPELAWSISDTATRTSEFFAWHFGWDKGEEENILWFWVKNTGVFIPLVIVGIYLIYRGQKPDEKNSVLNLADPASLVTFYLPFAFCFLVSNSAKLAPWQWDNIKVLIYWFVGSLPFAAAVIAFMWSKGKVWSAAAALLLIALTFSGALDVWRTVSGQINYKVFDADAVTMARRIKAQTAPDAVFLNAPTYNTAVVLFGRLSLMRYTGHLASHGIDYREREADIKRIYEGGADARELLAKYGIDYILVSPEERRTFVVNDEFFRQFPLISEVGQYKVYRVQ